MAKKTSQVKKLSLPQNITNILEETRIVLPGTETFLGFQLASTFSNVFRTLPQYLKELHLASIFFVTVSIILLITIAAIDRIANREIASRGFVLLASRLIVSSLACLSIGISLDLYLVASLITQSTVFAFIFAGAIFLLSSAFWLGFPFLRTGK